MMMFGGGLVIMLLFLLILIGVPLLIIVLVAGKGLMSRSQSQLRPNVPPPAPSAPLRAGAAEVAYVRKCPTCGRGVKADWNVCPSCGAALT